MDECPEGHPITSAAALRSCSALRHRPETLADSGAAKANPRRRPAYQYADARLASPANPEAGWVGCGELVVPKNGLVTLSHLRRRILHTVRIPIPSLR